MLPGALQWGTRIARAAYASTFVEKVVSRGLVAQHSNKLTVGKIASVYLGFDPTAPSLHIGHLLPLMVLAHAAQHQHPVYALLGGTTAAIGDPTGRLSDRPHLGAATLADHTH